MKNTPRGRTVEASGYVSVAEAMREEIRSGQIPAGSLIPTERELSAKYGVSRVTLRRAISALVSSGWGESSPSRGVVAKIGPVVGRNRNIGFVDDGDQLNRNLFFALSSKAMQSGFHLVNLDSRFLGLEGALEHAAKEGFVGSFVWSKTGNPDTERIRQVQTVLPIVALNHKIQGVRCDLVAEDNFAGARMAAAHLARMGRKRIAVTGMMDMLSVHHERFSGYLIGQFDEGLNPSPIDFTWCMTSGMESPDLRSLKNRLMDTDRPDAIFVMSDIFIGPVVELLDRLGFQVPSDIALVAFGDDSPCEVNGIGVTTIAFDWDEFADAAMKHMQTNVKSHKVSSTRRDMPVKLIIRGSCGAPKESWENDPARKTQFVNQNVIPSNGGVSYEATESIYAH